MLRWLRTLCNLLPLAVPSLSSLIVAHRQHQFSILQLLPLVGLLYCTLPGHCELYDVDELEWSWPQTKVWSQVGGCDLSWEAEFLAQVCQQLPVPSSAQLPSCPVSGLRVVRLDCPSSFVLSLPGSRVLSMFFRSLATSFLSCCTCSLSLREASYQWPTVGSSQAS